MSIWIRIANSALSISIGRYAGFHRCVSPIGWTVQLACIGIALFWDMNAAAEAAKSPLR